MEKIATLKSDQVPERYSIFKLHLSLLERGWLKEAGTVFTETFRSLSGRTFSYIRHSSNGHEIDRTDFYIEDDAPQPEISQFLEEVLSDANVLKLAEYFQINLQSLKFDDVVKYINQKISPRYSEDLDKFDGFMLLAPISQPPSVSVPQGYVLGPLQEAHIELVARQWSLDSGVEYSKLLGEVRTSISDRPGFGVFPANCPAPVAWCCIDSGGAVRMLHVQTQHRGRGLARILVRSVLSAAQQTHGTQYRLHSCVKKINTPSLNLFLSEGWDLQPKNFKIMFVRKY